MWYSKSNTLVKEEDGTYRKVKKGDPMPEAAKFQRPHVWATWKEEEKKENSVNITIKKEKPLKKKKRGRPKTKK